MDAAATQLLNIWDMDAQIFSKCFHSHCTPPSLHSDHLLSVKRASMSKQHLKAHCIPFFPEINWQPPHLQHLQPLVHIWDKIWDELPSNSCGIERIALSNLASAATSVETLAEIRSAIQSEGWVSADLRAGATSRAEPPCQKGGYYSLRSWELSN